MATNPAARSTRELKKLCWKWINQPWRTTSPSTKRAQQSMGGFIKDAMSKAVCSSGSAQTDQRRWTTIPPLVITLEKRDVFL